jgi:hypothetical protein
MDPLLVMADAVPLTTVKHSLVALVSDDGR